ncbi:HupE/UreJ family protein [Croceicoccus ponticola]|nr:HupE/UreJ family protein [Croceicoccus ponticola]
MVRAMRLFVAFATLLFAQVAHAHLTPNSEVTLSFEENRVDASIVIPAAEYAYASGNRTDNSPASLERARRYLRDRTRITGPTGETWPLRIDTIRFAQVAGPSDLLADARFVAPAGARPGPVVLRWSAVVDEVPDHFVMVQLRQGSDARVIGALRSSRQSMTIDRQAPILRMVVDAAWLGALHIGTGYDHLLFLLFLLWAAPRTAFGGRWVGWRNRRETLVGLGKVVTGFTLGHSATLIAAGLGNWHLPTAPVELAIAASVVVTAIHAFRPIFPGREALVACGFGFVHGLAFATLLAQGVPQLSRNLPTLAGFNLGIEAMQLFVLAVMLPPYLMIIGRKRRLRNVDPTVV